MKVTGLRIVLRRRLLGGRRGPPLSLLFGHRRGVPHRRSSRQPNLHIVDDSTSARSASMGCSACAPQPGSHPSTPSSPLTKGAGGGDIEQSLELEWASSFSSLNSAFVETMSQLADIPWDPMSYEWGAMSKSGSPAIVLCELVVDRWVWGI